MLPPKRKNHTTENYIQTGATCQQIMKIYEDYWLILEHLKFPKPSELTTCYEFPHLFRKLELAIDVTW